VDGAAFRVEGTLDPSVYTTGEEDSDTDDSFNDAQDIIYDMNSASNAFVIQSTTMDAESANSLGVASTNFSEITRTITIDIKNSETTSTVYGTISYTAGTKTVYGMNSQFVFSSAGSNEELENIYLIYQPGFNSSSASQMNENIVINNPDNYPVNVYLVKQEDASVTALAESLYHVNVTVNEAERSGGDYQNEDGSYNVVTQLRTNVDATKIALSFTPPVTIGTETIDAEKLVGLTDLVSGDAEERLYKVTLKVYEQGDETGEALYEMEGTKGK
jgi:hypothetical protein